MKNSESINPMKKILYRAYPSRPSDKTWTFVHIVFADGSGAVERYNGKLEVYELRDFISTRTTSKNVTVTNIRYYKFSEEITMNVKVI